MKQEYQYTLARTDRICLIAFVALLMGWELIKYLLPPAFLSRENPDTQRTIPDTALAGKIERVAEHQFSANPIANNSITNNPEIASDENVPVPLDLMTASLDELRDIGFPYKIASNIRKYIDAGGSIQKEKDLMKMYGMDSTLLETVRPYLVFPATKPDTIQKEKIIAKNEKAFAPIDLNTATLEDLEALPGIGAILAERIIKFRDNLGGFISIQQLRECYGLSPETFDKIQPRLTILQPVTTININTTDLSNIHHPYLPYKISRILAAYLKQHGPITSPTDLQKIYPPDTSWYHKLLPYLTFQ